MDFGKVIKDRRIDFDDANVLKSYRKKNLRQYFFCLTFVKNQNQTTMDFGKVIKDRRAELGISQEKLGDAVGVTRVTIYNMERGKNFRMKLFLRCMEVLKLKIKIIKINENEEEN